MKEIKISVEMQKLMDKEYVVRKKLTDAIAISQIFSPIKELEDCHYLFLCFVEKKSVKGERTNEGIYIQDTFPLADKDNRFSQYLVYFPCENSDKYAMFEFSNF